ncbi:MAG: hypothetical protein JRH01_14015 [Deltaproteobacteria bacterium]|nr:hypothetical protein [Deltaproteobacteria bacterium]
MPLALLAALASNCARPASIEEAGKSPVLLDQLGQHRHPVTTSSPRAQQYFDQGLALTYGFNHEAAVDSFEEATRLDPACAMCFWGVALALGPNINAPMGPEAARRAHSAVGRAVELASGASATEQETIQALATRYSAEPPEDRSALDRAYADAMRELHERHPNDNDIATLYAEALMDLMPWNYWTSADEPRAETKTVLALLEGVLEREPEHLGANHYLIHAVEEYHPRRAEAAADRLAPLAEDAGHLVHMPSHIYWRVGRYNDALEINERAAAADEEFFAVCSPGAFYRAAYYPHNIHFLWAAAATEGRSQIALTAARKLAAKTAPNVSAFEFMQEFMAIPIFTLARFGKWDAILGEPRPDAGHVYLSGVWHYARGLARVRTGDLPAAQAELEELRTRAAQPESEALILAGGTASSRTLLGIAAAHLQGELAAASGHHGEAVSALEDAVAQQDALVYMEPPPFYFPVRQALGAVLLDDGQLTKAAATYRRDLELVPSNGWSRFGLATSLRALGDPAADDADAAFRSAWARADVELQASRF